jgi:hypothetical protein
VTPVAIFHLEPPPLQEPIDRARIEAMLALVPRRSQLAHEWTEPLHEPRGQYKNWSLVLPFCETFANAFHVMCEVPGSGLMSLRRCVAFLDDANENPATLDKVREWLALVGRYVAMRDCLALSFALDYDRERGDPGRPQTAIGTLRTRAKPYEAAATKDTFTAADELVMKCMEFLAGMTCYASATAVVAMPPSRPDKPFDLPTHLAKGITKAWGRKDLSSAVVTTGARPALKDVALSDKVGALEGTVRIDKEAVDGQVVLLIDDLYQSGVSMNWVGMELLNGGAKKVFGLACEKTCRNDDNVRGAG